MPPKASTSKLENESVRAVTRKAATRTAVSNALILPWPTIPQHARSQVLSATLDLLQGVKQFRQARAKYTKRSEASPRPFKKRKRDEISQSDVTNTQKQSDSRQFHQIALRSGQQVHIPVHDAPNIPHLSSPRESKEKGKSKQLEPPVAPVIMSSLLVGINSVQSHLELYTQSARAQLSSQGLPFKDPPTQFSWAILLQRRKEARKRKLTNYPILRGSRRATLAHKGHKDPFPRNSASFMFLQNQFGKPLIQSAHQHVISVGKPLPGLDLPSLFLDPSYFSNRGRSILSEGYKKKFNRSQGIKLPPALSEATMAVLQAVGGRETSAFIRKRKKRMTDQQYKERRQARLKEKAAAKSTKEKRHGMEKKPLPETPSTNAYSKGFPNPKPSTKPTRHIFPRPTQEPAHDSLHDPLRIILVCRTDVNPQDLLAHFPNTVAAANGLLSRCDRQPIDLVQLNAGAEKALSDALGIKSAAVVGIKSSAKGEKMDALLQLIHHHQPDPLRSAHLDGSASLVKLESAPTTIRMLQTMVPVDPRALRFQRRMEKKKNKQNKINRDVKKKKKQQQAEKSKATSTAETQQ